jgi:hypothetical protein
MSCNNKSDGLKFQKCSQKPLDVRLECVKLQTTDAKWWQQMPSDDNRCQVMTTDAKWW